MTPPPPIKRHEVFLIIALLMSLVGDSASAPQLWQKGVFALLCLCYFIAAVITSFKAL